jgi:hypothetical protein
MYVYERFNGILKSFVRNRAYPEGSMVQGYRIEKAVEWALNYADPSNPIGVPKSHHEGIQTEKETIEKKTITPDPNLFHCAYFHVLQQMYIVSEYLDENKEVLLRDNSRCNKSWLANEHMWKFIGWLWDQISQSDTQTSEYLKKLARGPIFTVVTYQWYDINRYTFYAKQQDKCPCHVPQVPWVTGYDPKFWTRPVPSNDKQLGNHTSRVRYAPTTSGWREGTTNLKRTNSGSNPHLRFTPLR